MHPLKLTRVARLARALRPALFLAPAVVLTCCATNTETGAAVGGGLGALTGAVVGSAVRAPVAGAAIGAGVGALTGAAIGHDEDKREARAAAAVQARALGLTDVAQMAQQNVPDDIIINQIRVSPTVFTLSATDITWLRENRVSDAVIREMQLTATRLPRRVYTEAPVYGYDPGVVVVEPAVGVGYVRYRRW
jgi:uncharacterized membrane protein